jgi:hypothetical protein
MGSDMSIHEPMTMATDYLLASASVVFAIRLWRTNRAWAYAFLFTALGSFLGGTYHGFAATWLWKPTVYAIGLASFFLLLPLVPLLAVLKFIAYATWMIAHDDFKYVIIDYGTTLLVLAVLQIVAWLRHRAASAPWILGSIAVSVVGAFVQQSGFRLHEHFNHNDLYHVIQLVGLWLLYRGGLLLTTPVTAQSPTRPM